MTNTLELRRYKRGKPIFKPHKNYLQYGWYNKEFGCIRKETRRQFRALCRLAVRKGWYEVPIWKNTRGWGSK